MSIIEQIKTKIEDWLREYAEDSQFELGKRYGYKRLLSFLSTIKSEKPINQERLDENIKHYIEDCGWEKDSTIPVSFVRQIASHFYDLGCRRTAEKYDEIEYNRQRAEESVPNDLEEAARKYQESVPVDTTIHYCGADEDVYFANRIVDAVFAGAKWQAEQDQETIELAEDHAYLAGAVNEREKMMKGAVEGYVGVHLTEEGPRVTVNSGYLPKEMGIKHDDKVRIIIVKEDSHE